MLPVAYLPIHEVDSVGALQSLTGATFTLRVASADTSSLTPMLKEKITRLQPELRINNVRAQVDLVHGQTIRERLLAMLALFFAGIALLLAAIGLYGVLSYSVVQREREIGIRLALGSGVGKVAQLVTSQVLLMVVVGAVAGGALGMASVRFVQTLLFDVRGNDPAMLALPTLVLLGTALLAALPAVIRAARVNPALMLRAE
jgi:ABC-type antimicrobial peptide transport system permease subunit